MLTNIGLWRESRSTGKATMDERALGEVGYPYDIAANSPNDIFIVGDWGLITHFNGRSWYSYSIAQGSGTAILHSVCFQDNQVIIVGTNGAAQAIIVRGIR